MPIIDGCKCHLVSLSSSCSQRNVISVNLNEQMQPCGHETGTHRSLYVQIRFDNQQIVQTPIQMRRYHLNTFSVEVVFSPAPLQNERLTRNNC